MVGSTHFWKVYIEKHRGARVDLYTAMKTWETAKCLGKRGVGL